jgi:hypothetical protein
MVICINPGSGPVADATEAHAVANIAQFCADCADQAIHDELAGHYPGDRAYRATSPLTWERRPDLDADGRFGFLVRGEGIESEVEMPGLPLEQVRYLKREGQNIWHFPRLYVDGGSWVWCFGLLHREPLAQAVTP